MVAFTIGLLLIIISAISEAIMDKIQFHFEKSIFSEKKFNQLFWNPRISWKNKWKEDLKTERFLGSSTIFVSITDAWHLFKSIRTFCLFSGLTVIFFSGFNIILCAVIARILYGLVFTLFFDKILLK